MSDTKVALVTGASRGIGRAIALELDRAGVRVCLNCLQDMDGLQETAGMLSNDPLLLQADVSDAEQVKEMFKQIRSECKQLDILVNNAGITRDAFLAFLKEDDFDDVVAVSMKGAYLCMKHASKMMIFKKWGRIINIGSAAGLMGDVQRVNYAGAKAGLIGMTKSAARELAAYGITVNCIAPGLIETAIMENADPKKTERILELVPLARAGKPEEVADAVGFLASDAAGYITGTVLQVDGGLYTG